MSSLIERERAVLMGTFRRQPLTLVRGEGCYLWDDQGRKYLDLVAGIAVNILGHCHPVLVEAITRQAGCLMHVSNLYYTEPQVELAERLTSLTGMDQVFFANSGAEANEGAIKLARKFGTLHRGGAFEIITALHSFHGRTLATLAATGQEKYQRPFAPMPEGFTHVPFNDLAALEAAIGEQTVAVMLEPVQGESGIHAVDRAYLQGVRALCDRRGLLLIADEVQSGMGRTGSFLASAGLGVAPDIVTLAKGLCGGLPAGAVLARGAASCFEPGDHGSTLGGNPLVCAAGLATLNVLRDEDLAANAGRMGLRFLRGLECLRGKNSAVATVRGIGLMLAFDLREDCAAEVVTQARERGLLLNATGPSTLRMVPPLTISETEVETALGVIDLAVRAL